MLTRRKMPTSLTKNPHLRRATTEKMRTWRIRLLNMQITFTIAMEAVSGGRSRTSFNQNLSCRASAQSVKMSTLHHLLAQNLTFWALIRPIIGLIRAAMVPSRTLSSQLRNSSHYPRVSQLKMPSSRMVPCSIQDLSRTCSSSHSSASTL